jgi:hypothetical protein
MGVRPVNKTEPILRLGHIGVEDVLSSWRVDRLRAAHVSILLLPVLLMLLGIILADHAGKSIPVEACGHFQNTRLLFSSDVKGANRGL